MKFYLTILTDNQGNWIKDGIEIGEVEISLEPFKHRIYAKIEFSENYGKGYELFLPTFEITRHSIIVRGQLPINSRTDTLSVNSEWILSLK